MNQPGVNTRIFDVGHESGGISVPTGDSVAVAMIGIADWRNLEI
jgi:hypothetical protein